MTENNCPSLPSTLNAVTEDPTFTFNFAFGFVVPIPTSLKNTDSPANVDTPDTFN